MAHKLYEMAFSRIYPLYLEKVQKKGRTKQEVDEVITWLTGYTMEQLNAQIETNVDLTTFFQQAPHINPNTNLITGIVCGVRVEAIEDPLMQKIRWMDKLIDELAKGKKLEKILRS